MRMRRLAGPLTGSVLAWLLLVMLSVQCLSWGLHQGRHSAFDLSNSGQTDSARVQKIQALPDTNSPHPAPYDRLSEGTCSLCQLQRLSTAVHIATPEFVPLGRPGRHVLGEVSVSLPFKVFPAFAARAPPRV